MRIALLTTDNREPLTDEDFARYNRERWRPREQILRRLRQGAGRRLGLIPRESHP